MQIFFLPQIHPVFIKKSIHIPEKEIIKDTPIPKNDNKHVFKFELPAIPAIPPLSKLPIIKQIITLFLIISPRNIFLCCCFELLYSKNNQQKHLYALI